MDDITLAAKYYTDEDLTELVASISPPSMPFNYSSDGSADYSLYIFIDNGGGDTVTEVVAVNIALQVRKMSCGVYRIYNNKDSGAIAYIIADLDEVEVTSGSVGAGTYVEVTVPEGIFTITSSSVTQFLVNNCEMEECYTKIAQEYLCSEADCCDTCKITSDKISRITANYNLYKKIVDLPEVYQINYSNVDMQDTLSAMYTASELATKIKDLCKACGTTSNCGCH